MRVSTFVHLLQCFLSRMWFQEKDNNHLKNWAYTHKEEPRQRQSVQHLHLPAFVPQYKSEAESESGFRWIFKLWSLISEQIQSLLYCFVSFCVLNPFIYSVSEMFTISTVTLSLALYYIIFVSLYVLLYNCIINGGSRLSPQIRADFYMRSHVSLQADSQASFDHQSLELFL